MDPKPVSSSRTIQVQILMPSDINGYGRLFGGKLMEWIDVVGAVTARRHSGRNVTTVEIDNLHFKAAAYTNSTIVLEGCVTYVGRTSMEVRVDSYVEELDGERELINRAYSIFVALDENEQPTEVPSLILETQQEKDEWEAAKRRRALREQRAKDGI